MESKIDYLYSSINDKKPPHGMGALTFCKRQNYSVGYPCMDRTTAFGLTKIALHAEEDAIRQLYPEYAKYFNRILCKKMKFKSKKKIDLIVMKLNKSNDFTNSKCCSVCYSIMKAFSIRNVYYYNEGGELTKEKISEFKPDYHSSGFEYFFTICGKTNNNVMYIIKNKTALHLAH